MQTDAVNGSSGPTQITEQEAKAKHSAEEAITAARNARSVILRTPQQSPEIEHEAVRADQCSCHISRRSSAGVLHLQKSESSQVLVSGGICLRVPDCITVIKESENERFLTPLVRTFFTHLRSQLSRYLELRLAAIPGV